MRYKWVTEGQQDDCIKYVCHLGPHKLEIVEDQWVGSREEEVLLVAFYVYTWNFEKRTWDELETYLKPQEYHYKKEKAIRGVLEDWYACNVLLEDHLGSEG